MGVAERAGDCAVAVLAMGAVDTAIKVAFLADAEEPGLVVLLMAELEVRVIAVAFLLRVMFGVPWLGGVTA